jgi:hypothetical protein
LSTYATDSWSTITGLASVAYGSPERYPEIANQVIANSPVGGIVNSMTPAMLIEQALTRDKVLSALEQEYINNEEFSRYVDKPGNNLAKIANNFHKNVLSSYGEMSSYETSFSNVIDYLNVPGISGSSLVNKLKKSVPDLEVFTGLASVVPARKPDKLPASSLLPISDSIGLTSDYRGVEFSTGYLTPEDYFAGIAFPGAGTTAQNLPDTILKSLSEGYVGYATTQPLESLLRSGLDSLVTLSDIQDAKNASRSLAGLGTIGTIRDFTGIGALSPADQQMYAVDVAKLVVEINGYTTYQPEINSNGDFITPVKDTENSDPGRGLPFSQRIRTTTF